MANTSTDLQFPLLWRFQLFKPSDPSAWTRPRSESLSPRVTFSAPGTCTVHVEAALRTQNGWWGRKEQGNCSHSPCQCGFSCYSVIRVPFLGLAQRPLKTRGDIETALIPGPQGAKSLRFFSIGRSNIPIYRTGHVYQAEPLNLAGNVYRPTKCPCRSVGLSVYPLHWTVINGLYGIVAGFFPPKNSRFILDHLGCFSVFQYRSVTSRDRCQIHARCTRKTLILSYRRIVEGQVGTTHDIFHQVAGLTWLSYVQTATTAYPYAWL